MLSQVLRVPSHSEWEVSKTHSEHQPLPAWLLLGLLPVTDGKAVLIRRIFFPPQVHQGGCRRPKPPIFQCCLEERCLPGHRREAEFVGKGNCLFGLTVGEEHVHRPSNFQAQTSEKKKKIPAKAISQAGYWFLQLSNMPHTFAPRSLHSTLQRHFVPRQLCQEEDTGGGSLPGHRAPHTQTSVGSALCYSSGPCCMWKYKWKLVRTTEFAKPVCLTRTKHEPRTAWFELLYSGYPT